MTSKVRNGISIFFAVMLIVWLLEIDWDNLISKANRSAFFGIITAICMIIAMQLSNKKSNQ